MESNVHPALTGSPPQRPDQCHTESGDPRERTSHKTQPSTRAIVPGATSPSWSQVSTPKSSRSSLSSFIKSISKISNWSSLRGISNFRRWGSFASRARLVAAPRDVEPGNELGHDDASTAPTESLMSWRQTAFIMSAETVSLGILSLAHGAALIGLLPITILILLTAAITYTTGIFLWRLKLRHPHVRSFGDAYELILGKPGRWIADLQVVALLAFIMAGHVVIFSTMANQIAARAGYSWQCTVVFEVIAVLISTSLTMLQKFKSNTWTAMASCGSITAAALTTIIGVVVRAKGHPHPTAQLVVSGTEVTLEGVFQAVSMVIVSFTGCMAYLPIMHEMRNITDFPKALGVAQLYTVTMYIAAADVIYWFIGVNVPSPALGAAGPTLATLSFSMASITIVVAGVITGLVTAKMVISWSMGARADELHAANGWIVWLWRGIVVGIWALAFLIANVVPQFGLLLALIGAAVGSSICMAMPAGIELWNAADAIEPCKSETVRSHWFSRHLRACREAMVKSIFCHLLIILSFGLTGLGLYGTVSGLMQADWNNALFSCKSNL